MKLDGKDGAAIRLNLFLGALMNFITIACYRAFPACGVFRESAPNEAALPGKTNRWVFLRSGLHMLDFLPQFAKKPLSQTSGEGWGSVFYSRNQASLICSGVMRSSRNSMFSARPFSSHSCKFSFVITGMSTYKEWPNSPCSTDGLI